MSTNSELPDLPTNMVEAMLIIAEWLDLGDEALVVIARQRMLIEAMQTNGPIDENDEKVAEIKVLASDKTMQGDLYMWAEWFRQHPDIDAQMFAMSSLNQIEGGD